MKSYFTFSKSQKIGVVTIAIIIIAQIIVLNTTYAIGLPDPFVMDDTQYLIEETPAKTYNDKSKIEYTQVYSIFDPNELSMYGWTELGFSEKQAKSILSYKIKIGGFKQKEDLKRVYVISENKYKELEPYIEIQIKSSVKKDTSYLNETKIRVTESVELNTATKKDLIEIKGIGSFTADGILELKDKLGGFHSIDQLNDVYGITIENLELIKPQVEVNPNGIKKLNVNVLSISELKTHPYVSWDMATAIINQKFKTSGGLKDLNFLVEQELINQEKLIMLLPYIDY